MRNKAVLGWYFIVGAVNVFFGAKYILADQFMPYHSQATGVPWQEVETGMQVVILALMKTAAGGWFALGFITIILAVVAFKTGNNLLRWALPLGTLIFYVISFLATWDVHQKTGASTPWQPSLIMIGFVLFILVIDAPWSARVRYLK